MSLAFSFLRKVESAVGALERSDLETKLFLLDRSRMKLLDCKQNLKTGFEMLDRRTNPASHVQSRLLRAVGFDDL